MGKPQSRLTSKLLRQRKAIPRWRNILSNYPAPNSPAQGRKWRKRLEGGMLVRNPLDALGGGSKMEA